MWLAWEIAAIVGVGCPPVFLRLRRVDSSPARLATPFARELATMFALYTLWQLAGKIAVIDQAGAFRRAQQLWDFERDLRLPNELAMQQWFLPHDWLIQASNVYYGLVHVPAMIGCLLWLFLRDRHYYSITRNNLAMVTGSCLLIQLVAVVPPRFLADLGFVDTGVLHNQSVFSSLGYEVAGQLQAMPSIHAAWAFLVGVATWQVASGGKRYLGPLHAVLTLVVIVVTANHFWMDAVAAGVVLAASMMLQSKIRHWLSLRNSPAGEVEPLLTSQYRGHPRMT